MLRFFHLVRYIFQVRPPPCPKLYAPIVCPLRPSKRPPCTLCVCSMHPLCSYYVPAMCRVCALCVPLCARYVPSMCRLSAVVACPMRPLCALYAPPMCPLCALYERTMCLLCAPCALHAPQPGPHRQAQKLIWSTHTLNVLSTDSTLLIAGSPQQSVWQQNGGERPHAHMDTRWLADGLNETSLAEAPPEPPAQEPPKPSTRLPREPPTLRPTQPVDSQEPTSRAMTNETVTNQTMSPTSTWPSHQFGHRPTQSLKTFCWTPIACPRAHPSASQPTIQPTSPSTLAPTTIAVGLAAQPPTP